MDQLISFSASTQTILTAIPVLKYGLLFLLTVIEGPLVAMIAGLLASLGFFNLALAYLVIIAGDLVSDSLYYSIGFWGREKSIKKYGRFLLLDQTKLHKFETLVRYHSGKVLILGKLTHFAGVPILLAAGLVKIPYRKFIWYDTLATLPKSLAFLLLGYYFGGLTGTINRYLEYGTLITGGLLAIIFAGYLFAGKYLEKKLSDNK
ncbi:MAG: DedA family protein [Candidatus Margulisiibacteriota bacterium]